MIRFYFDSFDGDRLIVDQEGLEFSTPSLMRDAAIAALPDMARDELPDGDRRQFWIHVRDAEGCPCPRGYPDHGSPMDRLTAGSNHSS